jgi:hypothetical protein
MAMGGGGLLGWWRRKKIAASNLIQIKGAYTAAAQHVTHVRRSARFALMPRLRTTDGACPHRSTPWGVTRNIWILLSAL